MTRPKLTIGMPHYDDWSGVWATIQSIRIHHRDVVPECEIIVVDNNPSSPEGKRTKRFVEEDVAIGGGVNARYIPASESVGSAAPKNRVFAEASGDAVLCMDCHVLFEPGTIRKLIQYHEAHPDTRDLLQGPVYMDNLRQWPDHFNDVWGDDTMWGTWGHDPRSQNIDGPPYEIPAMGMGVFSCRRDAWLGYNPAFRGFGGEEWYIHEKFRQHGAKCWCLPFLRWLHCFEHPRKPFPNTYEDRAWNYIVGHTELGLSLSRPRKVFVGGKKVSVPRWRRMISDAGTIDVTDEPDTEPNSLEEYYQVAARTPSDINEHLPKLREMASQCQHVTEFGTREGVSTTALLAGQPARIVSYDLQDFGTRDNLDPFRGITILDFRIGDSRKVDIEPTDMLLIDTVHTSRQLFMEMMRHADQVKRWFVLHDTHTFGEIGEHGQPGLLVALRRFMRHSGCCWSVVYHSRKNNGLTVLSRDPADVPVATETLRSQFARAVAKHEQNPRYDVPAHVMRLRLQHCQQCDQRDGCRCEVAQEAITPHAVQREWWCPLGKWYSQMRDSVPV